MSNDTTAPCVAWDAEFYSSKRDTFTNLHDGKHARGSHHARAIFGPEDLVRAECRKFANEKGVKRLTLKPRPEYNAFYKGEVYTCPPTAILRKP